MIPSNDAEKPRVENISCILPETSQLGGLYLGNVYGAQNPKILKEYGIRAVITTSAETGTYQSTQISIMTLKTFLSILVLQAMTNKITTYQSMLTNASILSNKTGQSFLIQEVYQCLCPLLRRCF